MNDVSYLETTKDVYRNAAENPDKGLCCTTSPIWQLPELTIPQIMLEMNYGCGTTVHPRDLVNNPTVLYVGVGGGMELLQFAYFCRKPGFNRISSIFVKGMPLIYRLKMNQLMLLPRIVCSIFSKKTNLKWQYRKCIGY